MTAIIIIVFVLLLIFFLLASFITAELEYDNVFKFKIKYLFFTIAKDPLSPKEIEKKKRKEEKKKRKEERKGNEKETALKTGKSAQKKNGSENGRKESKEGIGTLQPKGKMGERGSKNSAEKSGKPKITPELVIRIVKRASPHVKRIFRKIRFDRVYVDITVGGDDAAKTAISYGAHCAAIDGLTAFLDNTVSFKAEKIGIRADFDLEKSKYYAKGRVKLRLSTLLHSGIWGALAIVSELRTATDVSEMKAGAETAESRG